MVGCVASAPEDAERRISIVIREAVVFFVRRQSKFCGNFSAKVPGTVPICVCLHNRRSSVYDSTGTDVYVVFTVVMKVSKWTNAYTGRIVPEFNESNIFFYIYNGIKL